jgi:signal transduction histidine kinase
LLMELVPEGLMDEQLGVLLGHLTQAMAAEIGAPVDLAVQGDCELPAEQRIALYRIAQEALYNIAKHASASRVLVELTCGPGQTQLHICDNGRGFTPGSVPSSHMGVKIMRTRAEKAGAFFAVHSQPGSGTEITVTVPLANGVPASGRRRP